MIGLFLNLLDTQSEKDKFTALYEKYKNLLYYIAFSKVHNNEVAEECVQETFFYVAKHFDKIGEIDSGKTKGYLAAVVTGFAIDYYNKENKVDISSSDDDKSDDLSYFENFDALELTHAFDSVLNEEEKIYIYLKYIYGYKSLEIAKMYGISDALVRKKLERAKNKLKKYYKEENYD